MNPLKFKWLFFFLITITLITGCSSQNKPFEAEKGVLNLTHWDIEMDGNIHLNGEWGFYWQKLLYYEEMHSAKPDEIVEVPDSWDEYLIQGKNLPGKGYATYRLHVKTVLPVGAMLGLKIDTFSSAYRLYVNERLIASCGSVGTSALEEVGEYRPRAVIFSVPAKDFDLIIQVSNYHYAKGGLWSTFLLGSAHTILELQDSSIGKELFLLGALLIIALFYFAIYILRKELKYTLYFALLCLCLVLTVDITGQHILTRVFPQIGINVIIAVWYSSVTWSVVFLQLFVSELFPSKLAKIIARIYIFIAVTELLFYLVTPPVFYTRFGEIANYSEILGVFFALLIVAIGIRNGYKDGWLNIISMLILLLTHTHDVLYTTNIIRHVYGEIFFGGLFSFIFIQMVIQARRIKAFHEQEVTAELKFLQAQIKPHFLYNSLNTIISISQYDIDKARELLRDFSQYLRRSFDFRGLSQLVPLKHELDLAKAYIQIEKARFEERLEVTLDIPEDQEIRVPMLMLQPIIENAIIHGILPQAEGGRIDVSVSREESFLIFKVKDNGLGMTEEEISRVLKQDENKGIGLFNIDHRLRKLYGLGLTIISYPDKGTEISWFVPIAGRRLWFN